jgi:hypothetical protein
MVNARLVELAEAIGETQFWTGGRYKTSCGDRSDDCFEWVGNSNVKFCEDLPNRDNDGECAQCCSHCPQTTILARARPFVPELAL